MEWQTYVEWDMTIPCLAKVGNVTDRSTGSGQGNPHRDGRAIYFAGDEALLDGQRKLAVRQPFTLAAGPNHHLLV